MPVSRKRGRVGASRWQRRVRGPRRKCTSGPQYARTKKGKPGKFYNKVKTALLKASDTKVKYQAYYFGGGVTPTHTFNHDTLSSCLLGGTFSSDNSQPTSLGAGSGDNQRNGTEIYSLGFRVRGTFGLPFDRRNTTIKIWMVEYNSNQGSPTDSTQWYRNVTGNNLLDPINTERFPGVKLLRTLRATARDLYVQRGELTDAGNIHSLHYDIWIPWKRHLRYAGTPNENPRSGCKETVALVMACYDTRSAAVTDNVILDHDQMVAFYYKDP